MHFQGCASEPPQKRRNMKAQEYQKLDHGLYRINWKSGGFSLASVGSDHSGTRWYAPTNWCGFAPHKNNCPCTDWRKVESVELLFTKTWEGGENYDIKKHF